MPDQEDIWILQLEPRVTNPWMNRGTPYRHPENTVFSQIYASYQILRWQEYQNLFTVLLSGMTSLKCSSLNLPNPRGGGGGGGGETLCPPPPPGTLPQICQERLELQTWYFLTINDLISKTKKYYSTASAHPSLPQQRQNLTHVFEKQISAVFMQKLPITRCVFATSIKSVQNGVCWGTLGLIFRLMASRRQFSFRTHFNALTTLNWTILFPWHQEPCHSI